MRQPVIWWKPKEKKKRRRDRSTPAEASVLDVRNRRRKELWKKWKGRRSVEAEENNKTLCPKKEPSGRPWRRRKGKLCSTHRRRNAIRWGICGMPGMRTSHGPNRKKRKKNTTVLNRVCVRHSKTRRIFAPHDVLQILLHPSLTSHGLSMIFLNQIIEHSLLLTCISFISTHAAIANEDIFLNKFVKNTWKYL